MSAKTPRPLDQAISEVRRELKVRERCYPRWIAEGKIDQVEAEDRFDRLASAIGFLENQAQNMLDIALPSSAQIG